MWYLIGATLFVILFVFFLAIIHNKKLIEKYAWIAACHVLCINHPENYFFIFATILLWPLVITIIFIIGIGYCLFKIFSKLIDYFVK